MKKVIEDVYSNLKGCKTRSFIFLNLQIIPQNLDVNVHPTKQEVKNSFFFYFYL